MQPELPFVCTQPFFSLDCSVLCASCPLDVEDRGKKDNGGAQAGVLFLPWILTWAVVCWSPASQVYLPASSGSAL